MNSPRIASLKFVHTKVCSHLTPEFAFCVKRQEWVLWQNKGWSSHLTFAFSKIWRHRAKENADVKCELTFTAVDVTGRFTLATCRRTYWLSSTWSSICFTVFTFRLLLTLLITHTDPILGEPQLYETERITSSTLKGIVVKWRFCSLYRTMLMTTNNCSEFYTSVPCGKTPSIHLPVWSHVLSERCLCLVPFLWERGLYEEEGGIYERVEAPWRIGSPLDGAPPPPPDRETPHTDM